MADKETIGKSSIGAALQATQSSIRQSSQSTSSAMRDAIKSGIGQSTQGTQDRIRGASQSTFAGLSAPTSPPERQPTRFAPPFSEQFDRSIDELRSRPPGGGGASTWPMQLIEVDTENVKVRLATVNGIVPTNINTNIDVSGSNTTWAIYLWAILDTDGSILTVEVASSSAGTVPADDDTNAYLLIGQVTVAAAEITEVLPSLAWSQTFVTCGRDEADPATTPGTYYWVAA
jgi:hypothetical protein